MTTKMERVAALAATLHGFNIGCDWYVPAWPQSGAITGFSTCRAGHDVVAQALIDAVWSAHIDSLTVEALATWDGAAFLEGAT